MTVPLLLLEVLLSELQAPRPATAAQASEVDVAMANAMRLFFIKSGHVRHRPDRSRFRPRARRFSAPVDSARPLEGSREVERLEPLHQSAPRDPQHARRLRLVPRVQCASALMTSARSLRLDPYVTR